MHPERAHPIVALLCDRQGAILQIMRDDAGIVAPALRGRSWIALLDGAAFTKALNFIGELTARQSISGWEINTWVGDQIVPLHFAGGCMGDRLLIVGAPTRSEAAHTYEEELGRLDHNEAGDGRQTTREQLPAVSAQVEHDGASYDELAQLNHELVDLQVVANAERDHIERDRLTLERLASIFALGIKRSQAEEALHESEKMFRSVVEQSRDGVAVVASSGTIVEWNSGAEQITGLQRSEVIGQAIWDVQFKVAPEEIRTPALRDQFKAIFEELFQTRQIPRQSQLPEFLVQKPDGTRAMIQESVFPIETDEVFLVCSIMRDVTALKQAEEELRKLSRAVEQSPTTVVITDTQGNIEYVNPHFAKLTGYTPQEVIGKNPRLLKSGKQSREFYQELWGTLLAGKEWRGEFINKNKAGELYWEMAAISAIRNNRGAITHFVKVAEDATHRVRAEKAVRQARDGFATLLTVSQKIVSTLEINSLLDLILEQLASVVAYSAGALVTVAQGQVMQSAYRGPRQVIAALSTHFSLDEIPLLRQSVDARQEFYIPDMRTDPELVATISAAIRQPAHLVAELRSALILPLVVKDRVVGLLLLAHPEPEYYDLQARSLAQIFANQAAIAIENALLYQQASEAAAQAARLRLADDLHDSVTQTVYGINLYADAARLALAAGKTEAAARDLQELAGLARDAMAELRLLIFEMRPPALETEGLVKALIFRLDAVEKRSRIHTDFRVLGERRLPLEVEVELYWAVLEALNNTLKHARATKVAVHFSFKNGHTVLTVRDNGVGFDPDAAWLKRGLGLRTIQERVERVGGHVTIESVAGQGTTVRIEVDR